ncbi:MAG: haloacid dehalogenase type II, partial [Alphaproteobacteria bacterium]
RFADLWRERYQPSMTPIREGRRPYVPLDRLHRENLDAVLAALPGGEAVSAAEREALTRAWERLDPWPDVHLGLARLRARALVAPCSNGSIALMARLARHAGLRWDAILGADLARTYKPRPEVYRAACDALGLAPGEVMMVAAHEDDLAAAAACGLRTAFIPRPLEHGPEHPPAPERGGWDTRAPNLVALADAFGW